MLINFHNLVEYGGTNMRAKIFVHGESVFNSGQIHKIGTLPNAASSNVKVHAVCKQSSHVKENPFIIDGEITDEGKIEPFRCTCGAGTKCKHILAALLHCLYYELPQFSSTDLNCSWNKVKTQALANYQPISIMQHPCFTDNAPKDLRLKDVIRNNYVVDRTALADIMPAVINSTNIAAESQNVLSDAATADLAAQSLHCDDSCDDIVWSDEPPFCDDSQNMNMDEKVVDESEEAALEEFCYRVFSNLLKSMYTKSKTRRHDAVKLPVFTKVNDHEREMYKQIFSNQDSELIEMLKLHKVDPIEECCQNTLNRLSRSVLEICENTRNYFAEWQKERKYIITGTTGYPLYTYSKNQKSREDWISKCQWFIEPGSFSNDATEYGIKNESKVRAIFKTDNPHLDVIETGLIKCPTIEWLGVSPDAVVFKDEKPFALLEIKCFTKGKTVTADAVVESQIGKCLEKVDGVIRLKQNHKFYGQVQQGMALLNVDRAYFVIHSSFEKKNYVLEIPKDLTFLSNYLQTLKRTYYSVLLPEICLRESNNPQDSCHINGNHYNFSPINVKKGTKKSKPKNPDDNPTKQTSSIAKDPKKKLKRDLLNDGANLEPKKKLKLRLR